MTRSRRGLPVAALIILLTTCLTACSGDADDVAATAAPTAGATTSVTGPATEVQGPRAGDATSEPFRTLDEADVTDEQRDACLQAIRAQLAAGKAASMPEECAVLPDAVVSELVGKALGGDS